MDGVLYRAAGAEDIPEAAKVYVVARNDMLTRNRLTAPDGDPAAAEAELRHILQNGIFQVAEVGGRLAAVCYAIVRGGIWFLSGFWVLPEMQGQKVGGPLLRRVWEAGRSAGAGVFCVWSSVDTTAMASYMKLGMLPGTQILRFSGPAGSLALPDVPAAYETQPLTMADAAAIDQLVRGAARKVDHQFWAAETERHGTLVLHRGKSAGYYYVLDSGEVAPAAWLEPADGAAVLTLACREGIARAGRTGLKCVGSNHQAIQFALASGMRLDGFSHFLTSGAFGKLEQYVTSGPLLF